MISKAVGALCACGLVVAACSSDPAKGTNTAPKGDAGASGEQGEGGKGAGAAGSNAAGDSGAPTEGGAADAGAPSGGAPGGGSGGAATSGAGGTGGIEVSTDMTPGYLSGTRLRAVFEVSGSTQRFVGWHDAMLNTDCQFKLDSAGTERCLPKFSQGSPAYADVDCKQPIIVYTTGDDIGSYQEDAGYTFTCGKGPRYRPIGIISTLSKVYYQDQDGKCNDGGPIATTQTARALGAVVPDTAFVAKTKTVQEARDARLNAVVRVAEDGSREVTGFYDLTSKAVCVPELHAGDGFGCVPFNRALANNEFYSDDMCMTHVAFRSGYSQDFCALGSADVIQFGAPNAMDTYYAAGPKVTTQIYENIPKCGKSSNAATLNGGFFVTGAALPFSTFAPFALTEEGTGRVQAQTLRTAKGAFMSTLDFYDSTLGETCSGIRASDGVNRCFPESALAVSLYSDTDCKVALITRMTGAAPSTSTSYYVGSALNNAGETLYKIGAKTSAPAHAYMGNGFSCDDVGATSGLDFYATMQIAPSDIPAITRKVE